MTQERTTDIHTMPTLLIRHATLLVTMDAQRREIADGAVLARDGVIEAVGVSAQLPATADEVIDARGQVVIPGLVNTHHHMYQTLTRALPAGAGLRALRAGCGRCTRSGPA